MKHILYIDGNKEKISWVIKSRETVKQSRKHAEIYYNKVTTEQSKYIALHVGLFWGIGTFIIKNEDKISTMIDLKSMYNVLTRNTRNNDFLIKTRINFINHLLKLRKLDLKYIFIDQKENLAKIT